jgi:hypothetical protein
MMHVVLLTGKETKPTIIFLFAESEKECSITNTHEWDITVTVRKQLRNSLNESSKVESKESPFPVSFSQFRT